MNFHAAPTGSTGGGFALLESPSAARFSFYSEEEIRRLSVQRLRSEISFDGLLNPVEGGLYDPRLGPTERSHGLCPTCGLIHVQCPGHLGHIELSLPVYNPFVVKEISRILSMMCGVCHRFRMAPIQLRLVTVKLLLLETDLPESVEKLDTEFVGYPSDLEFKFDSKRTAKLSKKLLAHKNSVLNKFERLARKKLRDACLRKNAGSFDEDQQYMVAIHMSNRARQKWREVVKEFKSQRPKACAHEGCRAKQWKIRLADSAKIFRTFDGSGKGSTKKKGKKFEAMEKEDESFEEEEKKVESKTSDVSSSSGDAEIESSSASSDSENEKSSIEEGQEEEQEREDDSDEEDFNEYEQRGSKNEVYMTPLNVRRCLESLWKNNPSLCSRVWSCAPCENNTDGYKLFFLQTIAVPPSKFRPPSMLNGETFENPQNTSLASVLKFDGQLREKLVGAALTDTYRAELRDDWVKLQKAVNTFLDSNTSGSRDASPGVRQALEKKEGLFRQNLMGKRVNYAARSVISPDPYIGTDEVGLPVRFARKLTFPEPVTAFNAKKLADMVMNGPEQHPGALFVEDEDGRLIDLARLRRRARERLADSLGDLHVTGLKERKLVQASRSNQGDHDDGLFRSEQNKAFAPLSLRGQKKVWRHVVNGDIMLANRQPTLHKPSLMAHKVKVIDDSSMQTIRLHYSNCNAYNADFDGDEINLHLPQSELCRAEAYEIAYTDHQYCSTTDGSPLRGLIQDHIVMGVMLTKQDTFLSREEYVQMVFEACSAISKETPEDMAFLEPCVLKPRKLWSGKQVISTLLRYLVGISTELFNMGPSKTKIRPSAWNENDGTGVMGQTRVVVRYGELCAGVLDKSQLGASSFGLVHSVYGKLQK